MAGMMLIGVFVTGLLVALALALIWVSGRLFPYERRDPSDVVRATLQQRYDHGEITVTEYEQALRALEYNDPLLV